MMIHPNVARLLSLGVVPAAALCGCLDFTPITLAPSDAGAQDAPIVTIDVDAGACEPCVEGPSCSAALATCAATPKCTAMFECGLEQGCYAPQANLVACLTICGQQAGLTGETDPAVTPFLALYDCATTNCAASCAGH